MLKPSYSGNLMEAGLDEAGRGCLAGPVVASFVVMPQDYSHPYLNDSKQLTKKQREKLRIEILKEAIDYGIAEVCNTEIDKINILNASFLAMHRALDNRKCIPELLLIDGNRFKSYPKIPHQCIVEGDTKYYSIAAASVLAKTYRDDLMLSLSIKFPMYGWESNMGYATKNHRKAIRDFGITPYHRLSFSLMKSQIEIFEEC